MKSRSLRSQISLKANVVKPIDPRSQEAIEAADEIGAEIDKEMREPDFKPLPYGIDPDIPF